MKEEIEHSMTVEIFKTAVVVILQSDCMSIKQYGYELTCLLSMSNACNTAIPLSNECSLPASIALE